MNKIKQARQEKGLSQDRLARLANVSSATIIRAEKDIPINSNSADRLAKILEIDPKDILVSVYRVQRDK